MLTEACGERHPQQSRRIGEHAEDDETRAGTRQTSLPALLVTGSDEMVTVWRNAIDDRRNVVQH